MEIIALLGLLVFVIYFRWIVAIFVGILFTIGGDLLAGIIAGFVTYWLLKFVGWWLAYIIYKSATEAEQHQKSER